MSEAKLTTNDAGKPFWTGISSDSDFSRDMFHDVPTGHSNDHQIAMHTNIGTITVLERETGFSWSETDTESGFRDTDGKFWLASGDMDVTRSEAKTVGEAIQWIKDRANTCVGD